MGIESLEPPPTYAQATAELPLEEEAEEEGEEIILSPAPRGRPRNTCGPTCRKLRRGCTLAGLAGVLAGALLLLGSIYISGMLYLPPNWDQEFTPLPIAFSQPMTFDAVLPANSEAEHMYQVDLRHVGHDIHELMSKQFTVCVESEKEVWANIQVGVPPRTFVSSWNTNVMDHGSPDPFWTKKFWGGIVIPSCSQYKPLHVPVCNPYSKVWMMVTNDRSGESFSSHDRPYELRYSCTYNEEFRESCESGDVYGWSALFLLVAAIFLVAGVGLCAPCVCYCACACACARCASRSHQEEELDPFPVEELEEF